MSPLPTPSGCDCIPIPPSSCTPLPPHSGINNIRMFFGYDIPSGKSVPGQLEKLYYTNPVDKDFIENGFSIPNYSFKSLVDSQILPNGSTFTLTERELLSTNTYQSWIAYGSYYMYLEGTKFGSSAPISIPEPFSVVCAKMLAISYPTLKIQASKMWTSILSQLDTTGFYGGILAFLAQQSNSFVDLVRTDCEKVTDNQRLERLLICYEWIKNIHDTYYGKEFLVNISPSISSTDGSGSSASPTGICIKNESLALNSSAPPSSSFPNYNIPYYIDNDGTSQGFYTSDIIVDAGFPKLGSTDILGLQRIDWVQNNEGKIESFVKIGDVYDSNYTDPNNCALLTKKVLYKKFKESSTLQSTSECADWTIDLSKIDTSNYYLKDSTLYLKSSVENRFYIDASGIWAKVTLSDRVPLSLITTNPITAVMGFSTILPHDDVRPVNKKYTTGSLLTKAPGSNALNDIINKFNIDGARGNTSQLNLAAVNPPCLMPKGVVIPFKSNVYRYGPYFYTSEPDNGGGAEVIVQETIAPWNFIKSNDDSFLINSTSYPYCAMDAFGKSIARLSNKGIQQLEKGRATVVGLPCYNFGSISGLPVSGALDPTILTDISVDYGGGGFSTTYNFSTYSPRFGRTERYLLDSWQENIKNAQYINNYLRNEKLKTDNLQKSFNSRTNDRLSDRGLISKKSMFVPPKHKGATPNRLLFAGYYPHIQQSGTMAPREPIPPSSGYPGVSGCNPGGSGAIPSGINPSGSNIHSRMYTFAESSNAYTIEYVQNTYYQLAGMSMDGFYLPVSLRGVGSDPSGSPEFKFNNGHPDLVFPPSGQIPTSVVKSPNWANSGKFPRFSMRCDPISGTFSEWDDNNLPSRGMFSNPGYPIVSKNRDEIPPFKFNIPSGSTPLYKNCYLLPINQFYLNPYTTSGMLTADLTTPCTGIPWDDRKNNSKKGFVISSIVFGDSHLNFQLSHTAEDLTTSSVDFKPEFTDEWFRQKINNFRVPALRGPLVLQGWGYDTSGKPIPNSSDEEDYAQLGKFRIDRLTDKFLENWLENPKSWPVGPIDLRFDRGRGVWTCPSPNKIVVARLKEKLNPNSKAKAELINAKSSDIAFYENYQISGPNGEDVKLTMENTEIIVYDFLGQSINECSKVYVYYDDNRYIVLNSIETAEPKQDIVRFRNIILCDPSGSTSGSKENPGSYYGIGGVSTSGSPSGTWGDYAGYGDKYYNYHTFGIRIDCDGNPIDKYNNQPSGELTLNLILQQADKWLIELKDNAGKFGPSFGYFINQKQWIEEASTGYALLMDLSNVERIIKPSTILDTLIDPNGSSSRIYTHTIIRPTISPSGQFRMKFNFNYPAAPTPIVRPGLVIKCGDSIVADTSGSISGCIPFTVADQCNQIDVKVSGTSQFEYSLFDDFAAKCDLGVIQQCGLCTNLPVYEILFIESYARFLHGYLTQDLYPPTGNISSLYPNDPYKIQWPIGNASAEITHFYGDSPNGKYPIFVGSGNVRLPIRVFDPFLASPTALPVDRNSNPLIFHNATSGTPFLAIFNEKEKKYYLSQVNLPRNFYIGKVQLDWPIGQCATVELLERPSGCIAPSGMNPPQSISDVFNISYNVPSGSLVAITKANDNYWYLVESGISGTCRQTIGGEDVTKLSGWDATKVQVLGHNASGCLMWIDTSDCGLPSGTSPPSG